MIINTSCTVHCSATSTVDIEAIDSWDEIREWYIKWDHLHYQLDATGTWHQVALDSDTVDNIEWKRPESCLITDDFDNILEEI